MGPDLELKGRLETVMETSGNTEIAGVMEEPEDKHMRCTSNCEDNTFEMEALTEEQTEGADRSRDVDVDILDCTNSGGNGLVEAKYQDETESSSSFDGTTLSDVEDESEWHCDSSPALQFDGYSEVFRRRKKRLTSHWRAHIRPLMWRCKWLELKIMEFQSQAMKYEKGLADYHQKKQLELENCLSEGFGAKSVPFSGQSRKNEVMKRKKRKQVEDTVDLASYMSHHNLFSYYGNKRSAGDAAFMDDNWGDQAICAEKKINGHNEIGVNDELVSLEFSDGDNSLEHILMKIGTIESQVSKMKTRLQKVMSENAEKFSADKLSLLASCNASTSSARNLASPSNNGDNMPGGSSYVATQVKPEYNMGDPVMPESAASSHGEATPVPDIIESADQPKVGGSSKNIGNGILTYNRRSKEKQNNTKNVSIQSQAPKEEQDIPIPPFRGIEPELLAEDQPAPKIRSISKITATKNKRKRARRKAGSSKWSR